MIGRYNELHPDKEIAVNLAYLSILVELLKVATIPWSIDKGNSGRLFPSFPLLNDLFKTSYLYFLYLSESSEKMNAF